MPQVLDSAIEHLINGFVYRLAPATPSLIKPTTYLPPTVIKTILYNIAIGLVFTVCHQVTQSLNLYYTFKYHDSKLKLNELPEGSR